MIKNDMKSDVVKGEVNIVVVRIVGVVGIVCGLSN